MQMNRHSFVLAAVTAQISIKNFAIGYIIYDTIAAIAFDVWVTVCPPKFVDVLRYHLKFYTMNSGKFAIKWIIWEYQESA